MRFQFSGFVEYDLEHIADWIAQDSPHRSVSFHCKIDQLFHRIGDNPFLYQLRPDIGDNVRLATMGRYVVLFTIDDIKAVVTIERVVFGTRDLPPLFQ